MVQITAGGERKTTSWPSQESAMEHARGIKVAKREHGESVLTALSGEEVRDWLRVRDALGGATVSQLLSVWERHKREVGAFTPRPLRSAVDEYLAERELRTRSPDDQAHAKLYLGRMCDHIGDKDVGDVGKNDIRAWLKATGATGWSLVSHFKSARAFFGRAVINDWIRENPASGIEMPRAGGEDVSVISVKDAVALFDANKDHPIVARLPCLLR